MSPSPLHVEIFVPQVAVIHALSGIFSDVMGRRTIILICSAIHVVCSFVTSASQSYSMYIGVRFFVGGCIHSAWAGMFLISIETVCEPMRTSTGAVLNAGISSF